MPLRRALVWILLAAAVALAGGQVDLSALTGGADARGGDGGLARVTRVVDGDTIHVRLHGEDETVRYIGIDTPESVKPDTPVQCFAKAASAANERLVAEQRVRLVYDRERRDRYGRLLAYVYRAKDGIFVNARLVGGGYARTLTIRPNDRFAARFAALQATARAERRGLWAAC